ncbi:MAG: YggS family pyridoxal phosphate-dependent enzyme [Flavobacteriales bacterium]|nr:YggS family pyridoxal phosphate-dependent enzyme [Flavobacteriales bacterium]|tara:strand:+ start:508 stop:1149 length:642 start_codon:yes stop_codon:yes gene_type:complete
MSIAKNLISLKSSIPANVTLVAVSKTKPNSDILSAYNSGQKIFGENRVQELVKKQKELPLDIVWHMIGNLQTNKVKYIAPFISLIHSVDSFRLLEEINKRAKQNNRNIDCLLQVHIAKESTKSGFNIDDIQKIIEKSNLFKNIKIKGIMAMATFTNNFKLINKEFMKVNQLMQEIKTKELSILSIGMSGDYKIAINNGSNMIRIGSAIFGKRS